MTSSRDKVLQYLEEAHGTEASLFSILTAHIAMTPRGEYRDLLERHRAETRAQAQRLQGRMTELGASKSVVHLAYGLAQTAAGQAVSLALAPLNLLRGTGGEEKLLKNAKDEAASEMLEIATYDAIEAVAEAVGDEKTAVLAREHRTQEEIFLRQLREMIPTLAEAVVAAEVEGHPSFDPAEVGAADAARAAAATVRGKAGQAEGRAKAAAGTAKGAAGTAAARAKAVATDVEEASGDVADRAAQTVDAVKDELQDAAEDIEGRVGEAADEVRDEGRAAEAEEAAELAAGVEAVTGEEPLPIDGYDDLTVAEVLPKLRTLSASELARVDGYERGGKDRKRILDRISALRAKRIDEQVGTPTA